MSNSIQSQATNVVRRKHGVMNVRPTSNCNYTNARGGDTDSSQTPRLKHFPAESLRKSDTILPNLSSSSYKVFDKNILNLRGDSPLSSDQITSMAVPPSHGHGDSIKMHPVEELVQQSQQEQQQNAQQGSKQTASISHPNVPVEQHVDRTNQSETLMNKQVPSLGTRLHRPFVPHVMHGSTLRESSMSKAEVASPLHAPVRKSSTLSVQHQEESQQHHTRVTTAQRLQSLVPQQKLMQIPQQPMTHRINDDYRMIMGDSSLQKVNDSFSKPVYEKYPAVKECNTVCQAPSVLDSKLNNRQSVAPVGQPTTQHDITCNYTDAKLRAEEKQAQQIHQTQQRQQYVNWQGQSTVDEVQNTQKIYQQMRDNMIHQRQMQQRVLSQQQQMMIRASQRSHLSQTAIPYHGMMMQQRGVRDHTSQIRPHNAWVNNHQVIVASPNVNDRSKPCTTVDATMGEKSIPRNDALQYRNSKMDNRIPISPQQYLITQQDRDASMWNSKAPEICSRQQSQCQQPQPSQKYEPVSKDQHVQMMQHFGQHRTREPQGTRKKYAEFTPAMIRDQELLVQNMRHQRTPENIMRRQFDGLLDEQRRHLAFLNQVESAEMKNDALLSRNAKISIKDQRPDWMASITPARVVVQQVQRSSSREDFRLYQRKCNAGPPASPVHTNGGFHQSISSPQAVLSCPQRENTAPTDPMHSLINQRCDIPAQSHHQDLKQQKLQQLEQPVYEQHEQHHQNGEPPCNNLMTYEQQRNANMQRDNPSSLQKLRHKKYIRPQGQNNGLQGMETVKEMLKTFESSEFGKSLGQTMDMGNGMTVKFNGIQDPSELEKLQQPPVEYLEKIQQFERLKISANGLCNTRNADNPASLPKRLIDETARTNRSLLEEYPRQCHPGEKLAAKIKHGNPNVIAKEENGRIASTVRQENHDILFQDYGQAFSRDQYPLQLMTTPSNGGNPIASHSNVPTIPYKFNASWPQHHGNMEQFYRNQRNLQMFAKNYRTNGPSSTAQIPWTSTDRMVQPQLQGSQSKIMADFDRNKQELVPVVQSVATPEQPSMFTHDAQCDASILANNMACNNGQPEIRQPRIIGGLRYLARKVDYIQNPSLIAPNSFITSKFVQPLVSFN